MRRWVSAACTWVLVASAAPAAAAAAVTGSGTTWFGFTQYTGPIGYVELHTGYSPPYNMINGKTLVPDGTMQPSGYTDYPIDYVMGASDTVLSNNPFAGQPQSLAFSSPFNAGTPFENRLEWSSATFSNVAIGQPFKLGTLTFKNGSWDGSAADPANNIPSFFYFTLLTQSNDGPQFNQVRHLALLLNVNAPANNDLSTVAGMEAAADWVTIWDFQNYRFLNSFRVFDYNQTPAGFTNVGSVDLMGQFGSLDIIGFANPTGGFITADNGPLPIVPIGGGGGGGGGGGAIPEPASWVMLIAGFGLVGAVRRRRRPVAAS